MPTPVMLDAYDPEIPAGSDRPSLATALTVTALVLVIVGLLLVSVLATYSWTWNISSWVSPLLVATVALFGVALLIAIATAGVRHLRAWRVGRV